MFREEEQYNNMKITEIEVGEIFVPLAKPFKTALRTVENVEAVSYTHLDVYKRQVQRTIGFRRDERLVAVEGSAGIRKAYSGAGGVEMCIRDRFNVLKALCASAEACAVHTHSRVSGSFEVIIP